MCTILDIRAEGQSLKQFAHDRVASTVTHFEERKIDHDEILSLCKQIMGQLDKAVHTGELRDGGLNRFQKLGMSLYDQLFTQRIKEKLQQAKGQHLTLRIDESLVYIPWELLFDGQEFLSLNLCLGRKVYTRLEGIEPYRSNITLPIKILVIADPRNDLESAHQEGVSILEVLSTLSGQVAVDFKSSSITPQMLKLCIRDYDIVHYAGHAEYNHSNPLQSGWLMKDGNFTAEDIMAMGNVNKPMPALIFANACQSGKSVWRIDEKSNQQIFSLANAFLLSGVTHYIGTCRNILDKLSGHFALIFYQNLISGDSIGNAVHKARSEALKELGKGSILWASYLLYGDPKTTYIPKKKVSPVKRELPERQEQIKTAPSSSFKWVLLIVLVVLAIAAVELLSPKRKKPPGQLESKASVSQKALQGVIKRPSLIISSTPPGASVIVEGKTWGTTPLQRETPPGNYRLSVRKFGYQPLEEAVELQQRDVKLKLTLLPSPNWLMFRRDHTHMAGRGEKLTPTLKLKWKYATGARVRSGASLSGNTLYIGSEDNYIYALNIANGKLLWKCRTGGHIYSSPAVVGNRVYLSSSDGVLYALDSQNNGSILWRENIHGGGSSSPAISLEDGKLYVGTNAGEVYLLDLEKTANRIEHRFSTRGNIASSPVIYDRRAYVGSGDGGLYCVYNDKFKKIFQASGSISASPLIKDGLIYIGSEDERLYAVSTEGQLRWECSQISGEIVTSPVLADNKLFLGTAEGNFYSVSAGDGHLLWQRKLSGPVFVEPVISGDLIFVGCDDGNLYILQAEDGSVVGKYPVGAKIRSSPILVEGTIYFGADDHNIYALTSQ